MTFYTIVLTNRKFIKNRFHNHMDHIQLFNCNFAITFGDEGCSIYLSFWKMS